MRRHHRFNSWFRPLMLAAVIAMGAGAGVSWLTVPVRAVVGPTVDSKGTDFWLTFMQNYESLGGTRPLTLTLFITADADTTGTVTFDGGSPVNFSVTANTVTTVPIDAAAELTSTNTVESKGIHVTSVGEVTVYGLNRREQSTDAFLGLPTDILGREYIALGFSNSSFNNPANQTELAIVGTDATTSVTVVPSATSLLTGPYTFTLNAGQTYQLRTSADGADLSGSIITADKPIAVFGGHSCGLVPKDLPACDHLVEQLQPTTTWGRNFATMPLASRFGGDTFRFLAQADDTVVSVNGVQISDEFDSLGNPIPKLLRRGEVFEQIIDGAAQILSDKPVLVAQYSNGSNYDGVTSDPFMVLVPPLEQFQASYTVTTPATGFVANYINVVVPTVATTTLLLDGHALTSADIVGAAFTPIGTSGFSGAQLIVPLGSHTVSSALPLGITVYGFDQYDSYGYPGGMSLAPVAVVTSLALTPPTAQNPLNTEHCVTAAVTDQNGGAVVGVRVDFKVEGTHTVLGFSNTDAAGLAGFCYTGTIAGDDTITATQGNLRATAAKTWIADAPVATHLVLLPKTATHLVGVQHCVTATVTDQFDDPVAAARVDFSASGANTATGFAATDATGAALFCYVGAAAGTDAIVATLGSLTDTAAAIWEAPPPPPPPPTGCVRSEEEWKSPRAEWPVSSLKLGSVTYTRAQLVKILEHAARVEVRTKNGLVVLADELIAAKLNKAKGAPVPAGVAAAIADADALIGAAVVPPIGAGTLNLNAVSALARTLNLYNDGRLRGGPPACRDCVKKDRDEEHHDQGDHGACEHDSHPRKPHPRHDHTPAHHDGDGCVPGQHGHTVGDRCLARFGTHHRGDGCNPRDVRHTIGVNKMKR